MKIIIAPDKFKGSLTSFDVCNAIASGIRSVHTEYDCISFPMADGGDGFSSVMQYYLKTQTVYCDTADPLYNKITATYQWEEKNKTAIIEMATASGLVLLQPKERNVLKTSDFGTGLLIKDAIEKGARKIILGLGGSATNDGGMGILAALGFKLTDKNNCQLLPAGENLIHIQKIIPPAVLPDINIEIACDVQNTLYGPNGAAYVYAPQKGADDNAVKQLDKGLRNIAAVLKKQTGKEVSAIPGTGAAGGIAAGLIPYFNVTLLSGTAIVIAASNIEHTIKNADIIVTGEGKMDAQTLEGKVVGEICMLAQMHKVPVIAFCGMAENENLLKEKLHIAHIEALVSDSITKKEAIQNANKILTQKATQVFKRINSLL